MLQLENGDRVRPHRIAPTHCPAKGRAPGIESARPSSQQLKRGSLLCILMFWVIPLPLLGETQGWPCDRVRIPIEMPVELSLLSLEEHVFFAGKAGEAALTLYYDGDTDIHRFTIVLMYTYSANEPAFPLVFQAAYTAQDLAPDSVKFPVVAVNGDELSEPIRRGSRTRLMARAQATLASCPAIARLDYALLEFADGSQLSYEVPGWEAPAVLLRFPYHFVAPVDPDLLPVDFITRVSISKEGAADISSCSASNDSVDLCAAIREFVRRWSFAPKLRDASPSQSQIIVVFRFRQLQVDSHEWIGLLVQSIGAPIAIGEMLPDPDQQRWRFLFGGSSPLKREVLRPAP
jgi:hypothetical protein